VKYKETEIAGAYLIDLEPRSDERGFFSRYFCAREFEEHGLNTTWLQINNSMTVKKGTVRGLHFQLSPFSEVKLVRCIGGAIWDVIVDLRTDSLTFGKWYGAELSSANRTMMYVPKGVAHGFISLTDNSELLYLVSEYYSPNFEKTLLWSDPMVGIRWPMEVFSISEKDSSGSLFSDLSHLFGN
jgi:dTDP-4-dehydrorhamnose 3,5-epimerase